MTRLPEQVSWQIGSRPQEASQMREVSCSCKMCNGVPVVTAPEEIDMTNAPELRSALLEAATHGHRTLVVDMTRTRFCDSSGLRTLIAAHRRAQAEAGELRLAVSAAPVLRVFALTTIDRMIPHFPSLDQALAHGTGNEPDGHQLSSGAAANSERDGSARAAE